jgi:hypothetical protein
MRALAGLVVLVACAGPAPNPPSPDGGATLLPPMPGQMRLVQANVGNVAATCFPYKFKLCYAATEDRIRSELARHDADVIALQEVVARWQCDSMDELLAGRVCHPRHLAVRDQTRRLVGDDYTIVCDTRNQYDCIAVHVRFGEIAGCPPGELCVGPGRTAPAGPGCDAGFTAAAYTIVPHGARPFTLVNAHPPSGGAVECRRHQLAEMFEGDRALVGAGRALVTGDLNMDPFHGNDASVALFRRHVGEGRRFAYHSGTAEADPPYPTAVYLHGSFVYDHVASDFARGRCTTLGVAPNTPRLDGGSGTDHRALLCDLDID